ncbi:competence protein, ComEC-related, putative [Syntrophotalea carbinolica DSM 2380]|uniref:Competence protein, ComEC-related, putative n=2 Tax=Syntrophotalea carbinolica TaxID=19 RepID=Q3A5R4_SYNC1|nr:competence protein, ComEC-related, putative [Syntrophotalea carbinolica DSM 2380]
MNLNVLNMPVLAAAYVTGVLAAQAIPPPLWHPVVPLILAMAWFPTRHTRTGILLLMLFIMACGYCLCHTQLRFASETDFPRSLPKNSFQTIYGRIQQVKTTPNNRKQLDLRLHHVLQKQHPATAAGGVRLTIEKSARRFRPGDEIAVRTRLRIPRRFGTPGEYDYPRYLAAKDIQFTAFIPDDESIALLKRAELNTLSRLRNSVGDLIDRSVPDRNQAALTRALVIGDKDALPRPQRQRLAHLGLTHLFSISGFHFGLVATFGYILLQAIVRRSEGLLLLLPPRRLLPCLLLLPLWCYLQLTGQALPAIRAWLAMGVVAALLCTRRCCRPTHTALAIACVILVATPMALFMPSFQLSFAGVFGILIFLPRWSRMLPDMSMRWRRVAQIGMVTPAATITTTPFVLWHFHLVAPAGLLVNLWAGPLFAGLIIPAGLLGLILTPVWPTGAAGCFRGMGMVTAWILGASEPLLNIPALGPRQLYLPGSSLLLISLMVVILLLPWRKWHALLLLTLALALGLWPAPHPEQLRVTAFSVGQGDALLVSDKAGRHYLIDGGGMPRSSFDTGERLVAPALGRLGIQRLTAVILSHDHPDHRDGLVHILKHFPVESFWSTIPREDLWPPLRRVLQERHIPVRTFSPGWTTVEASDHSEVSLFVPPQTSANLNDRSMVFYARYGRNGVLLTGDLEGPGIAHLLRATAVRPVTLLKLPHHGSRTSPVDRLCEHFHPHVVFASLGHNNPFGFPHRQTLHRLDRYRLPLWRTDLHGTLSFDLKNDRWHVRSWHNGLFR